MARRANEEFWEEKETMKIILFTVVLGAVITMNLGSVLLLMGVAILIGYAYRITRLTKKEIALWVIPATIIGSIAMALPYLLEMFLW